MDRFRNYHNNSSSSSSSNNREDEPLEEKNADLIEDQDWEDFLYHLVNALNKYDKKFDMIRFLGEIKTKVADCSRAYTGMWTLDMLHQTVDKLGSESELQADLQSLQKRWDSIMAKIRESRKELICSKCIEAFFRDYKNHEKVMTSQEADQLKGTHSERWIEISRLAHEKVGADQDYQAFQGKLMVQMVKY